MPVAESFFHLRHLMTTLALTKEKPRLLTFRDIITYTAYHDGMWTKRKIRFGNGKKGTPAEFKTAWSQPDAFIKRYSFEQWESAQVVESGESYIDENGNTHKPLLMSDGFEVEAKHVAAAYNSFSNRLNAIGKARTPAVGAS